MKSEPIASGAPTRVAAERRARQSDAGAVLLVVMLVLLGLLGLGVTALWMTSGNLQVGSNINQRTQALYVAEAGIEKAREVLNGAITPDMSDLLRAHAQGGDNVPTAVDPITGQANGVGAILRDTNGTFLAGVLYPPASFGRNAGTADAPVATQMGRYTIWIRNDAAELRQGVFGTDNNNTVIVRSRGISMDGRTNVVLEVTLGVKPPAPGMPGPTPPPAPVLCNSGKNACDDNNSTQYGVVVN